MKRLILMAAVCAPFMLLTQCKEKQPTTGYTLDVTVANNPVKAYFAYNKDGETVVDSVDVVDNKFQFKGTAEEPFMAIVSLSSDPEAFYSPRMQDSKRFFIEPGTITLTSTGAMADAAITGSVINADADKWAAEAGSIDEEITANYMWFRSLTGDDQNEENYNKAVETEKQLMEKKKSLAEGFINANPDSWFALASIYDDVAPRDDADGMQALLDKFSPRLKETKTGKDRQARIDAIKATSIGATAPDFTQNDPDGKPVSLSSFRGQWVLIDFWASWCGPCRGENPHVVAAYDQYKDKGFTVLGVSLDQANGREAWLKAIEDDKLAWTQVSDLKGWGNEAAQLYAVSGIPANFLLNPEGVIVEKNLRGQALTDALAKYLN